MQLTPAEKRALLEYERRQKSPPRRERERNYKERENNTKGTQHVMSVTDDLQREKEQEAEELRRAKHADYLRQKWKGKVPAHLTPPPQVVKTMDARQTAKFEKVRRDIATSQLGGYMPPKPSLMNLPPLKKRPPLGIRG